MAVPTRLSQRARWAGDQPISYLMHKALADPELISLAAGFVDQATLPLAATQQAFAELLSDPAHARAALQYGTTPGHMPLRQAVLDRHRALDGDPPGERDLTPQRVIVTAGSNQLLYVLADVLCDPGDIVLCAAPTYFVYLGVLRNVGARAVGVAVDGDGILPEALDEQLQRLDQAGELGRVKAIYVVSYFDNPGTTTLSLERRPQVLEIARRWSKHNKLFVIDDAAYRDLRYTGQDVPSLRAFDEDDRVVVASTFSKPFAPGLRTGFGILPQELIEPVAAVKGNMDFGAPNLSQYLLAHAVQSGMLEAHLPALRAGYAAKMHAMLEALDEHMSDVPGARWRRPEGGLYVWLELPEGIDAGADGTLFDRALAERMLYVPGEYCFPAEGASVRKNTIRLSFGVQPHNRIKAGIAALARAVRAELLAPATGR